MDALHHLPRGEVRGVARTSHPAPKEAVIDEECAADRVLTSNPSAVAFSQSSKPRMTSATSALLNASNSCCKTVEIGWLALVRSERTRRSCAAGKSGRADADSDVHQAGAQADLLDSAQSR